MAICLLLKDGVDKNMSSASRAAACAGGCGLGKSDGMLPAAALSALKCVSAILVIISAPIVCVGFRMAFG